MLPKEQTQHHPDSGAENPCTADGKAVVDKGRRSFLLTLVGGAIGTAGCAVIPQAKNSGNAGMADKVSEDPVTEFMNRNTPKNLDGSVYYSAFGRGKTYSAAASDAIKRLTRFGYTWDENITPNAERHQPSGEWFVVVTGRKAVGDAHVRPDEKPAATQGQADAGRAQRERDMKIMTEAEKQAAQERLKRSFTDIPDKTPDLPAQEQAPAGNDTEKQERPELSKINENELDGYIKRNKDSYFQAAYAKVYKKTPLPGVKIVVNIRIDKNGSVSEVTFPEDGNTIKSKEFEEIISGRMKLWKFRKSPKGGWAARSLAFSQENL